MTSAADPNIPHYYYCHPCERTVSMVSMDDLVCPICDSSFIEEVDITELNSHRNSIEIRSSGDFADLVGLDSTPSRSQSPDNQNFDPQLFLQNYIESLLSRGTRIQVTFNGDDEGGSDTSASNIGDYVLGSGFENVVQQLFENDPNRHGPPPAARSAVEALPIIKVSPKMVCIEEAYCAVCIDEFEVGDEAMRMPCKHFYHENCIIPWLELHNSCPVCRYELPTDDPDYVSRDVRAAYDGGGRSRGTWLASEASDEESSWRGRTLAASWGRSGGTWLEEESSWSWVPSGGTWLASAAREEESSSSEAAREEESSSRGRMVDASRGRSGRMWLASATREEGSSRGRTVDASGGRSGGPLLASATREEESSSRGRTVDASGGRSGGTWLASAAREEESSSRSRTVNASVGRSGGTWLASAAREQESSSRRRRMRRRVRISLPCSLRCFRPKSRWSD